MHAYAACRNKYARLRPSQRKASAPSACLLCSLFLSFCLVLSACPSACTCTCTCTPPNGLQMYYITFPTYYAHNLLIGTLRMDIGDATHIICEKSNLRADVTFNQMGTFSGADRLHSVEGVIKTIPEGAGTASKKGGWFSKGGAPAGEELGTITGHYDKSLFFTPPGGATSLMMDLTTAPVAPKYVLPLHLQGPWESRRLWQFATSELVKRPIVDWAAVDREKAQLEEEQRMIPCHAAKPGAAGYADWVTKKFHQKPMPDLHAGGDKPLFVFDDMSTEKFKAGEPEKNLLHLSRTLGDPRGGLHGTGAFYSCAACSRFWLHVVTWRRAVWCRCLCRCCELLLLFYCDDLTPARIPLFMLIIHLSRLRFPPCSFAHSLLQAPMRTT